MLTVASTSTMIPLAPTTAVAIAKRRRCRPTKAEVAYTKKKQEEDVRALYNQIILFLFIKHIFKFGVQFILNFYSSLI